MLIQVLFGIVTATELQAANWVDIAPKNAKVCVIQSWFEGKKKTETDEPYAALYKFGSSLTCDGELVKTTQVPSGKFLNSVVAPPWRAGTALISDQAAKMLSGGWVLTNCMLGSNSYGGVSSNNPTCIFVKNPNS